jgi:hypothetical protein
MRTVFHLFLHNRLSAERALVRLPVGFFIIAIQGAGIVCALIAAVLVSTEDLAS